MTHLNSELKTKILALYSDGRYTQKELANRFKISDRTIKRWIENKNKYKNYLIIMDNGRAHKKECVKETIQETNNHLLYSVPYRPKTNAIESWFSQFKHYFKHDETRITFSNLENSVRKAIRKISNKSYLNYMKYAYKEKEVRKFIEKSSTRRRVLKKYKS